MERGLAAAAAGRGGRTAAGRGKGDTRGPARAEASMMSLLIAKDHELTVTGGPRWLERLVQRPAFAAAQPPRTCAWPGSNQKHCQKRQAASRAPGRRHAARLGRAFAFTAAAATAASQMTPGRTQLNGSGGDRRLMQGRVVARRLTELAGSAAAGPTPTLPVMAAVRTADNSNQWSKNHQNTARGRLERTACTAVCTADDAQPHVQMHLPRHLGWTAAEQTAADAQAITCEPYYKQTRLQPMRRRSHASHVTS